MNSCRLCQKDKLFPLLEFGEHPIAHRLLTNPSQEEYVHPVTVCFCDSCGLIQLREPIPPDKLYTEYNWLSSWKWNPHIPRLVSLIEQLPDLKKDDFILEVGGNDGSFLEILIKRGYQNVLGVEPAQDAQKAARLKGVETIGAYFNKEVAEELVSTFGRCDLLIARQVLEHITDLESFREAIHILLRPNGYVLLEVPNFDFSLSRADYSAIWEEHVNYFTLGTLKRFLAEIGIQVNHSETVNFSGEALIVVGQSVGNSLHQPSNQYVAELRAKALAYRDHWPRFREEFIRYLHKHQKGGGKVALYGAGCRACSLINFAGLSPYLEFVLDDQIEKQGKYMPGSRLPILPGESLEKYSVDLCLLAVNAENDEKVMAKHREYQKKGGCFVPILPPSDNLLPFWSYH